MFYCSKEFIGKTIKNIRKSANIKQSELAEEIGISEKHLSKIETGKNYPALDTFLKMANVLGFTLADFGINTKTSENKIKDKLLDIIYSSSNEELESYLELINTLNHIKSKK